MTEFEMLLACYRSGQVSERQWQGHLKDRAFREWVEARAALSHPTPDGCGREGKHALTDIMEDAKEDTLRRHPARCGPFVIEDGDLEGGDDG